MKFTESLVKELAQDHQVYLHHIWDLHRLAWRQSQVPHHYLYFGTELWMTKFLLQKPGSPVMESRLYRTEQNRTEDHSWQPTIVHASGCGKWIKQDSRCSEDGISRTQWKSEAIQQLCGQLENSCGWQTSPARCFGEHNGSVSMKAVHSQQYPKIDLQDRVSKVSFQNIHSIYVLKKMLHMVASWIRKFLESIPLDGRLSGSLQSSVWLPDVNTIGYSCSGSEWTLAPP